MDGSKSGRRAAAKPAPKGRTGIPASVPISNPVAAGSFTMRTRGEYRCECQIHHTRLSRANAVANGAEARKGIGPLVARRALSFPVSLLLALLRKKLVEADASSADSRLVLTRDQILEMLVMFLPTRSNEARLVDLVDSHIGKVVELGFLRKVGDKPPEYEVRRILKAFVDAQWLADLDERLAAYHSSLAADDDIYADDGGQP